MRAFAGATNAHSRKVGSIALLPAIIPPAGLSGVGSALLNGGTLVLRHRSLSAGRFWNDMVEYGCTIFVYIGELCRYLVQSAAKRKGTHAQIPPGIRQGIRRKSGPNSKIASACGDILEFTARPKAMCRCSISTAGRRDRAGAAKFAATTFRCGWSQFDVETESPVRGPDGLCIECATGEVGEAVGLIGADARHATGYADKAASERKDCARCLRKGDSWFHGAI